MMPPSPSNAVDRNFFKTIQSIVCCDEGSCIEDQFCSSSELPTANDYETNLAAIPGIDTFCSRHFERFEHWMSEGSSALSLFYQQDVMKKNLQQIREYCQNAQRPEQDQSPSHGQTIDDNDMSIFSSPLAWIGGGGASIIIYKLGKWLGFWGSALETFRKGADKFKNELEKLIGWFKNNFIKPRINPDIFVIKNQFSGLAFEANADYKELGKLFNSQSPEAQLYLAHLAVNSWNTRLNTKRQNKYWRGGEGVVASGLPKKFIVDFAKTILSSSNLLSIRDEAMKWTKSFALDFSNKISPIPANVADQLLSNGSFGVDPEIIEALANSAILEWSQLSPAQRAGFIDIGSGQDLTRLPKRFISDYFHNVSSYYNNIYKHRLVWRRDILFNGLLKIGLHIHDVMKKDIWEASFLSRDGLMQAVSISANYDPKLAALLQPEPTDVSKTALDSYLDTMKQERTLRMFTAPFPKGVLLFNERTTAELEEMALEIAHLPLEKVIAQFDVFWRTKQYSTETREFLARMTLYEWSQFDPNMRAMMIFLPRIEPERTQQASENKETAQFPRSFPLSFVAMAEQYIKILDYRKNFRITEKNIPGDGGETPVGGSPAAGGAPAASGSPRTTGSGSGSNAAISRGTVTGLFDPEETSTGNGWAPVDSSPVTESGLAETSEVSSGSAGGSSHGPLHRIASGLRVFWGTRTRQVTHRAFWGARVFALRPVRTAFLDLKLPIRY